MTQKEANAILQKKYPQGYIRYIDEGRKSNTNRVVIVTFSEHSKDYRYAGSYADALIRLGCMEAPPAPERTYELKNNMFINAMKNQ